MDSYVDSVDKPMVHTIECNADGDRMESKRGVLRWEAERIEAQRVLARKAKALIAQHDDAQWLEVMGTRAVLEWMAGG